MSKPIHVKCPTCEKSQLWDSSNPYRPFCSEKCKMIDLGAWANEEYQIPEDRQTSDYSSAVEESDELNSDNPINQPARH